MFGTFLEARIRKKDYLLIFFSAGIFGNFAYFLSSPFGNIPVVGASGAVYGIIGTLAVLYPSLIVYIGLMPMPMMIAAIFWIIINLFGMFTPSNIAYQSHLAGILVGIGYGIYLRRKIKYKRMIIDML